MKMITKIPFWLGLITAAMAVSQTSIAVAVQNDDPTVIQNTPEILNPKKLQGRVVDSTGRPADKVQFFETIQRLNLQNQPTKNKYTSPVPKTPNESDYAEGLTDTTGKIAKYEESAMFLVSQSGDEVAFIPPGPLDKEIKMRRCGALRFLTGPVAKENKPLVIFVTWKNCLAGSYSTNSESWRLKPYFSITSVIQVDKKTSFPEIKLPPGEVSISVLTLPQLLHLHKSFPKQTSASGFASNIPSMGIHVIQAGRTTTVPVKTGWLITGKLKKPKSNLPDWSVSKDFTETTRLRMQSAASKQKELNIHPSGAGGDSTPNTKNYTNFLLSEKGRELRNKQLQNMPVTLGKDGSFVSFPVRNGDFEIDAIQTNISQRNNPAARNVQKLVKFFYVRKNPTDKQPIQIKLQDPDAESPKSNGKQIKNIGELFIDENPYRTMHGSIPKRQAKIFSTGYSTRERQIDIPQKKEVTKSNPLRSGDASNSTDSDVPKSIDKTANLELMLEHYLNEEFSKRHAARLKELKAIQTKLDAAMKRLNTRYNNRQQIIRNQIRKLLENDKDDDKLDLPESLQDRIYNWKKKQPRRN